MSDRKSVAVIGGGVAGVVSAYLLSSRFDVTLIEKNTRLGGHTNTVTLHDGPDAGSRIDTGFIVCNDRTYPNFHKFLDSLSVPVRAADMSFGYHSEESGLQYAGTGVRGLFAQKRNLFNPAFLSMLRELLAFNKQGLQSIEDGLSGDITLRQYIDTFGYSATLVRDYLIPMGAAIWSSPDDGILDFPATTFLHFFRNHGLLTLSDRPQWQTVVGGSASYLERFEKLFPGTLLLGKGVTTVKRSSADVTVHIENEEPRSFDFAVIATHADQVLSLLDQPTNDESKLFGCWSYQRNPTVLHSDAAVMPPRKTAWASWNYTREVTQTGGSPVSVTYHMNRLQGLQCSRDYFVTLNRQGAIAQEKIVCEIDYMHPVFSLEAVRTQEKLPSLQGKLSSYYCGSYFGYGFHEDAVKSAFNVASLLGVDCEH